MCDLIGVSGYENVWGNNINREAGCRIGEVDENEKPVTPPEFGCQAL